MEDLKHFEKLFAINCNDKTEKKNNGSAKLTYLSWCYAWAEVKKIYPNANYDILKFGENKLPYVYDEKTGYMVFTRVEIEGVEHEMWLPVLDSANKAIKDKPYKYKVKEYDYGKWTGNYVEKTVEPATMFDINKTIMRCLTKNLAMFGLGLYIYAGEDLPEDNKIVEANEKAQEFLYGYVEENKKKVTKKKSTKKVQQGSKENFTDMPIQESQKQIIRDTIDESLIKKFLVENCKPKLSELNYVEAQELIETNDKQEEDVF